MKNGRLAEFICAITARVAVSYSVDPAMNLDPSGDIDNTVDWPVTVRFLSTTPEATSYTNNTVLALFAVWLMATMPTMNCPSCVRRRRPGNAVAGRPTNSAGRGAGVEICGGD